MDDHKEIKKVIMPMIRKVLPNIIANDIVGTQPMTGSIGNIFDIGRLSRWQRFKNWVRHKYWQLFDAYWRCVPGTVITLNHIFLYGSPSSEIREWLESNVGRRYWAWNWQSTLKGVEIKFILGKGKWASIAALKWS